MDGISREKAVELVRRHIHNDNLFKHCLASEAVLRAMAEHMGEDEDKWGLAGLLHDLDSETHQDLAVHTRETIMECEMIGIPIAEFCELSVAAMQEIADSLGL